MGKNNKSTPPPKSRTIRFNSKKSAQDLADKYGKEVKQCSRLESGNFKVKIPNLANENVRNANPHLLKLAGGKHSNRQNDDHEWPEEYWRQKQILINL